MFLHILQPCICLLGLVVTIPQDDKPKEDLELLRGKWVAVEINKGDRIGFSVRAAMTYKLTLEKTSAILELGFDDNKVLKGQFHIDPIRSPKTMDMTLKDSDGKKIKLLAIYRFKEGGLEFCMGLEGKERPKDFKSVKDEAWQFFFEKMVKEKPGK
jgi:uncharacterized protein (TIGR03067 family)